MLKGITVTIFFARLASPCLVCVWARRGTFEVSQPCWGLVFHERGLCFHLPDAQTAGPSLIQLTRLEGVPEKYWSITKGTLLWNLIWKHKIHVWFLLDNKCSITSLPASGLNWFTSSTFIQTARVFKPCCSTVPMCDNYRIIASA